MNQDADSIYLSRVIDAEETARRFANTLQAMAHLWLGESDQAYRHGAFSAARRFAKLGNEASETVQRLDRLVGPLA